MEPSGSNSVSVTHGGKRAAAESTHLSSGAPRRRRRQRCQQRPLRLIDLPEWILRCITTQYVGSCPALRATCRAFWSQYPPSELYRLLADDEDGRQACGFRIARMVPSAESGRDDDKEEEGEDADADADAVRDTETTRALKCMWRAGKLPPDPFEMEGARTMVAALAQTSARHNHRQTLDYLLGKPKWKALYNQDAPYRLAALATLRSSAAVGPEHTVHDAMLLEGSASPLWQHRALRTVYGRMLGAMLTRQPDVALRYLGPASPSQLPSLVLETLQSNELVVLVRRQAPGPRGLRITFQSGSCRRPYPEPFQEAHGSILQLLCSMDGMRISIQHAALLPASVTRAILSKGILERGSQRVARDVLATLPGATSDCMSPEVYTACKNGTPDTFYKHFPSLLVVLELVHPATPLSYKVLMGFCDLPAHDPSNLLYSAGGLDWGSRMMAATAKRYMNRPADCQAIYLVVAAYALSLPHSECPKDVMQRIHTALGLGWPWSDYHYRGQPERRLNNRVLEHCCRVWLAPTPSDRTQELTQLYKTVRALDHVVLLGEYHLLPERTCEAEDWRVAPFVAGVQSLHNRRRQRDALIALCHNIGKLPALQQVVACMYLVDRATPALRTIFVGSANLHSGPLCLPSRGKAEREQLVLLCEAQDQTLCAYVQVPDGAWRASASLRNIVGEQSARQLQNIRGRVASSVSLVQTKDTPTPAPAPSPQDANRLPCWEECSSLATAAYEQQLRTILHKSTSKQTHADLLQAYCTQRAAREHMEPFLLRTLAEPGTYNFVSELARRTPRLLRLEREHLPQLLLGLVKDLVVQTFNLDSQWRAGVLLVAWRALFLDAAPRLPALLAACQKPFRREGLKCLNDNQVVRLWHLFTNEGLFDALPTTNNSEVHDALCVDWVVLLARTRARLSLAFSERQQMPYRRQIRAIFQAPRCVQLTARHCAHIISQLKTRPDIRISDYCGLALTVSRFQIPFTPDFALQLLQLALQERVAKRANHRAVRSCVGTLYSLLFPVYEAWESSREAARDEGWIAAARASLRTCAIHTFPPSVDILSLLKCAHNTNLIMEEEVEGMPSPLYDDLLALVQ